MRRPEAHEIDSFGKTQLRAAFDSLGWTVNSVENDYGVDFEVEVFHDRQSTGVTFKIQLKSSRSTDYSANAEFVSENIERPNALYMCREHRTPILLAHADVKAKRTFWSAPQMDHAAIQKLATADCGSVTFRIPTSNEFPGSWEKLLEVITQVETLLALRALSEQPIPDFVSALRDRTDRDQIARDLKSRSDAIQIEQANDLLSQGSTEEAAERLKQVLNDPDSPVELRFSALLSAEFVEMRRAAESRTTEEQQATIRLTIASQLRAITRKGPRHLKFTAMMALSAAQLNVLTVRDWNMYLNWKLNQSQGDIFWKSQLAAARARLTRRVVVKFAQCVRLIDIGVRSSSLMPMLGQAIPRLILAIAPFVQRLRDEGIEEAAESFSARALNICKLSALVAEATGDQNALYAIAHRAAMLIRNTSSEAYAWALEVARTLKDSQQRDRLCGQIQEHGLNCDNAGQAELSIADEQRFYEGMAASVGVYLSSEHDSVANAVRVGIADLDPTRVLKNCRHLFVTMASQSAVGGWLQLPTMGTKLLYCTLHEFGIGGSALDGVYAAFKERHCQTCRDAQVHAQEWTYTHAWQRNENERHKEFVERVSKT
jgi:hypothetical protein